MAPRIPTLFTSYVEHVSLCFAVTQDMNQVGKWKQDVEGGGAGTSLSIFSADILTLSKRCVKTVESLTLGLMIPSISHTGSQTQKGVPGRGGGFSLKVGEGGRKVVAFESTGVVRV